MFVLGIDPGLSRCGYGVVEQAGRRPRAVAAGVLRTEPDQPVPQRLATAARRPAAALAEHRPAVVAVERVLFQVNARTAIPVAQAAGIAMVEGVAAGAEVVEYSPNQVKQAIAGDGGADKQQMERMVQTLLGIARPLRPVDAADAVALALCHLAHAPLRSRVSAPERAMIGSLRGRLLHRGAGEVVLEVGGIGYVVVVSPTTVVALGEVGDEAFVWVHHHVREDAETLYGFSTRDEKVTFEALLGAHGVGPSMALAILSVHAPAALVRILADDDVAALCLVPGVGKKTAARLLVELKSRLDVPDTGVVPAVAGGGLASAGPATAVTDVRDALVGLGYSADEIRTATADLADDGDVRPPCCARPCDNWRRRDDGPPDAVGAGEGCRRA